MQDMAVVLSHMTFTCSFLVLMKTCKAREIALGSKSFICNLFHREAMLHLWEYSHKRLLNPQVKHQYKSL